MEKGLLFDRIQLKRADVSVRYEQLSFAIESHAADTIETIKDHTTMTTRNAPQLAVFEALVEFAFDRVVLENVL